ncbi:MAG TPA: diguanylate cyclase [Pyrinomonadaceae bacterium]|nr:diguanylate cyclase [Pyrinomonadaceae bacterium]
MSDYGRAARACWLALVASGAVALAWAAALCLSLSPFEGLQLLALASFVVLSTFLRVRLPGTSTCVTAGDAFIFLGAILLGTPAAVLLAFADSAVNSIRTHRRAADWLAPPATACLTALASSSVFHLALANFAGVTARPAGLVGFEELIVPLVAMATTHYFANGLLIGGLHALKTRTSLWRFWHDQYLWTSCSFLAAALATGLMYQAIQTLGLSYVLLSVPVIGATFTTYKIYFERMNDKSREAEMLARLHLATVEALATAIDAKDQTTHCHVRRVQIYAAGLGRILGLPAAEIEALKAGALLHDVGKLAVPDHILNKPGKLTAAEFERMKIHTTVGAQILEKIDFPYPVVPIVRHHHERWDGFGYPDALRGEEIPRAARVFAVVDCFDSVREDRPFRRGMTREEACALLLRGAGTHFDPQIVELFLKHLPEFEAEVSTLGLDQHGFTRREFDERALVADGEARPPGGLAPRPEFTPPAYLEQIKNAHREVCALYEIAHAFGSSLDIRDRCHVLAERVGHVVPFDTCAVYLYDPLKGYAAATHVAGRNTDRLRGRCVAPGEGVVGFVLANRRAAEGLDPMLDFRGAELPPAERYRSMVALPLTKDERLLGVLAVYSRAAGEYSDDHARLLETVARLASDAFAHAIDHAEAESNALTDSLTGLPNARALSLRFDEEQSRSRRAGGSFQVVMLDLDDFKQVNDTFGHQTGDQMLREVARLLQSQLREYDFLARYAGDEFVALVQDLTAEQVEDLRARMERAVSEFSLRVHPGAYARVGVSVGAARSGEDGETLSQLLIAADQAMYAVKSDHKHFRRAPAPADPVADPPADASLASAAIN